MNMPQKSIDTMDYLKYFLFMQVIYYINKEELNIELLVLKNIIL